MNDPVFKDTHGTIYREHSGSVERLIRNPLRIYDWEPQSAPVPEDMTITTLEREGFAKIGEALMRKSDVPSTPAILETKTPEWIVETTGGFCRANSESTFVHETHNAVSAWDEWVPANAQQRRFHDMVVRIEERAKHEEDEYCFTNGKAM